ncbi:MAG: polysaccharide ABC transporter ATP-binding protein [Thiobacillus sp.]|nr:polysaccharide ABC transporter ATP-binding protein [Thiobacillus sp.]
MPIIEVDHLTKEYRLGAMQGIKQTLLNTAARLTGKKAEERPLFKALDDVNFSIEQGEVVGIIGHNGAGKSTLLKMLAKISTPTRGTVKVNGRIAPLIEVGAGFVPDFTGRENVYLNGAILGMSRQEIDNKFDEIVDFAEMAEFIDTPVKRYSSGMKVKLAFAVATSIESEIMIVDEVLAVGDLAFQRKCFDRMEELIKRQGKTVLLVSHNIRQVERLCSRVVLLDKGALLEDGNPTLVCNRFTSLMNLSIQAERAHRQVREIQNSGEIRNVRAVTQSADGQPLGQMKFGERTVLRFYFDVVSELKGVAVYVGIHTSDFVYLTNNNTAYQVRDFSVGPHIVDLIFDEVTLIPGPYSVLLWMGTPEGKVSFHTENLASFVVVSDDFAISRQQGQALFSMPASWFFDGVEISQTQCPPTSQL